MIQPPNGMITARDMLRDMVCAHELCPAARVRAYSAHPWPSGNPLMQLASNPEHSGAHNRFVTRHHESIIHGPPEHVSRARSCRSGPPWYSPELRDSESTLGRHLLSRSSGLPRGDPGGDSWFSAIHAALAGPGLRGVRGRRSR